MNKKLTAVIIACLSMIAVSGQTLFTYGKYSVDAKDFIKAYNKNNTQPVVNKAKAISDYLDLYIKSRLKIREAYDRKYDTLAQIKTEVENLRIQISESYMNDPEMIKRMQQEAFNRSQKDIRVAHIFISSKNATGFMDSTAARLKKEEVLNRLQKGEDFLQVAQQLSDDPCCKDNKRRTGFYYCLYTCLMLLKMLFTPRRLENTLPQCPLKSGITFSRIWKKEKRLVKSKHNRFYWPYLPDLMKPAKRKLLPLRIHYTNESWPEIILINWRLPSAMIM